MVKIFNLTKGVIPLNELADNAKELLQLLEAVLFFKKYPATMVDLYAIHVAHVQCPIHKQNGRCRSDIQSIDLSLPILIDSRYQLITCACRLHAHQFLQRKSIAKASAIAIAKLTDDHQLAFIHSLPLSRKNI